MKQRSKLVRTKKVTKKHTVAMKMNGQRLADNEEEKSDPKKDQRKQKTQHFATNTPSKTSELDMTMNDQ